MQSFGIPASDERVALDSMTSVAPKPDSEELFGRTHPPETAADLGERISPSASRSKTIVADSAVPGGSLEETKPGGNDLKRGRSAA